MAETEGAGLSSRLDAEVQLCVIYIVAEAKATVSSKQYTKGVQALSPGAHLSN